MKASIPAKPRQCVCNSLSIQKHRVVSLFAVQQARQQVIQPAHSPEDLRRVAELRANAFYEDQAFNRFKQSFIKQFAEQEFRRLSNELNNLTTTTATVTNTTTNKNQLITLIATSEQGHCTGTLDIRPGTLLEPHQLEGIPLEQRPLCAYILNVVVDENSRNKGIGSQLMAAAKKYSGDVLGCSVLYAHVEAVNTIAAGLYAKCGFETVVDDDDDDDGGDSGNTVSNKTVVGKRLLLRCVL